MLPFTTKAVSPHGRTVLITGASSGLGRACALHLAGAGFTVIGGVRRADDGASLEADGPAGRVTSVVIDVTDEEQVARTVPQVAERVGEGGLWGLVNNAGISVSAPLECVSTELLRRQLEINVVGQLSVTRAFLPLLRRSRGRLVNVTSGLGTVAIPYLGAYSAAQFAKEAMSDALRRELAPFGISVSVVAPGAVMTPIWPKIMADGRAALAQAPADVADLYRDTFLRFLDGNEAGARASRTRPAHVARAVEDAVRSTRPRTRYRVGTDVVRGSLLARFLPDRLLDTMFQQIVIPAAQPRESAHVGR